MQICKSCGKEKKIHARGLCGICYGVGYQADRRKREKRKVKKLLIFHPKISPRKMMHMKPDQILDNWDKILRAVGL